MQSRASGHHVSSSGRGATHAHTAMTKSTLKTALPTIVPKPIAVSWKVATALVKSSGAEPPAAMRVAPAMSIERSIRSAISSSAGTKNSSHTIASARKVYRHPHR